MRLIDADLLRKESKMLYSIHSFKPMEGYTQDQVDNAPTVEPAQGGCAFCRDGKPTLRGEGWAAYIDGENIVCNAENEEIGHAIINFCPSCGAKLEADGK